jgi:hypothetical protein
MVPQGSPGSADRLSALRCSRRKAPLAVQCPLPVHQEQAGGDQDEVQGSGSPTPPGELRGRKPVRTRPIEAIGQGATQYEECPSGQQGPLAPGSAVRGQAQEGHGTQNSSPQQDPSI